MPHVRSVCYNIPLIHTTCLKNQEEEISYGGRVSGTQLQQWLSKAKLSMVMRGHHMDG